MPDLLGYVVLALAAACSAWVVVLSLRFQRSGSYLEALARTAFVPEKRRRTLTLLGIEGAVVLLTGLAWGLERAGLVTAAFAEPMLAALLATAAGCVVVVVELGLSTGRLTEREKREIRRDAPDFLRSLAFVAAAADAPPPGAPSTPNGSGSTVLPPNAAYVAAPANGAGPVQGAPGAEASATRGRRGPSRARRPS